MAKTVLRQYWDIPEGTECHRKTYATTSIGGAAGLVVSAYSVALKTPTSFLEGVARTGRYTFTAAAIGAIFGLTSCISAQVREKPDDPLNYLIGGCAGGLILGARTRSYGIGAAACAYMGLTAALVKMGQLEGWQVFAEPKLAGQPLSGPSPKANSMWKTRPGPMHGPFPNSWALERRAPDSLAPKPRPHQATEGSSAHLPLRVLLWTWPFNRPVALSRCSELWPGTADCQLTVNRSEYPQADAVLVHHREVSNRPQMQLPPSPRPPGQRWVWFSMESPSNCLKLKDLDGYFNLTMSYRRDSDIFMPYGWLEPWPGQPVETLLNISAKTKLVAWVVSNWNKDSIRVQYYKLLKQHLQVDVYGRFHTPLPHALMAKQLSQYKFYLAFENSLHPDYITEKLWKNALQAWAVPVVLGPSRVNYEQFLPPKAFIHVEDFQSPKDLAQYLLALDKDYASYLNYFRWRETLRPRSFSWALMFCKACWKLQQEPRYQTVPSIASWLQ
ncbi:hypothetical protein E5288_WYG002432 [Bos mutus]|uniref:Fucosyltransferase n=2 Tax=Bos TaxID=9903 RepID=A0A6B0R3N5_9CETA|nr:hypothetical protein [Bos mutus]